MKNKILEQARQLIAKGDLGEALKSLKPLVEEFSANPVADRFEKIRNDYELMLDYMLRGFKDEKREELYQKQLQKLAQVVTDLDLHIHIRECSAYRDGQANTANFSRQHAEIRQNLESFVANVAMTSLETEEVRSSQEAELYRSHHQYITQLFHAVWLSPAWSEEEAAFYESLLLSPTIDSNDIQLLIGAIMLSTMNIPDAGKLLTLIHVYQKTGDKHIRQRALVAWVFSLRGEWNIYPELKAAIQALCEDENTCRELLELQMQVYYCMNAERDHEEIQREIIPTLMKNNNLNITRFGITEKEDDEMQDILNPDASDKAMEEVEQNIRKMTDMQRQGADIFFGGFSRMKSFPFFYNLSNWFRPFSLHHPELSNVTSRLKRTKILTNILNNSPFCDSDKYSFVLALASTLDRLPPSMAEAMEHSGSFSLPESTSDMGSPTYIRRLFLQDLYRVFRLYRNKNDFESPFPRTEEESGCELFFDNPLFTQTQLQLYAGQIGRFLMRQKHYKALQLLLQRFSDNHDEETETLRGQLMLKYGQAEKAITHFDRVLEKQPKHRRALIGKARACFTLSDFETAEQLYASLLDTDSQNKAYQLHRCICQVKIGKEDQAIRELYRLNYEQPEDKNILRVLAYALLYAKRTPQALHEYQKLITLPNSQPEDHLNAGYCHWMTGDIAQAVQNFRISNAIRPIANDFENDSDLLDRYHITQTEINLMHDLVTMNIEAAHNDSL